MTERDPGWKASVDGVVSDFDEVTRHLRRRQGQAVRVAWSVVGATALAMGALIGLDLAPWGSAPTAILGPLSLSTPAPATGTPGLPTAPGLLFTPDPTLLPAAAPPATPATPVTASATSTPRPHGRLSRVTAPVLAVVPVSPPTLAAVTSPPPPSPSGSPSPSGGIVDGLVGSIVHGTG